jgi:type II secretory ATPase GspE/PulE/Tfp pilus assembly ATPase PilB-like protein
MGMSDTSTREHAVPEALRQVISKAVASRASDIHFEPTAAGYSVRCRVDGMLLEDQRLDPTSGRAMVNRMMVLAGLLTYRLDVPQEGRFAFESAAAVKPMDLRLAVIPTVHGIRAVLRLPGELLAPLQLEELNLHPQVLQALTRFAASDYGMLICCGPAGSGKTTTLYSLLLHIAKVHPHLSVITLEDPVERVLPGVTQIEVSPFGQLTYEKALRSILRQDPQVLMLGEIRDPETASLAVQAALSGHRMLCTLHAPSPAGAIARLLEMGIEPYQLASALTGVLSLRLVRRRVGPGQYQGRTPVQQWVSMGPSLRHAVLRRSGPDDLAAAVEQLPDHLSASACAQWLLGQGLSDQAELVRAGLG